MRESVNHESLSASCAKPLGRERVYRRHTALPRSKPASSRAGEADAGLPCARLRLAQITSTSEAARGNRWLSNHRCHAARAPMRAVDPVAPRRPAATGRRGYREFKHINKRRKKTYKDSLVAWRAGSGQVENRRLRR
ncbi:hypothetical protein FNV43_RR20963 [Rhamnella rubrinervis]|uniref:Uncharacterized protein n=1 Tax=Rhamnella rubrinervis TaxID=2594499 RepID=A0A8K0DZS9_9ROSA|nr:hypothetical protein FNV43_RR20963 [Rhamnella rubrinervis]